MSTESLHTRTLRFGCHSHRGPEWTWVDKENEDFAFAAVRRARNGDPWVLAGVCDGVGNSTWSERGAKHAAAAFLEVVTSRLGERHGLAEEMQRTDGKHAFATAFQRRVQDLLEADARLLLEGRYLHSSWKEDVYDRTFLRGRDAAERRAEWLQTTLLATALGPRGGFALLLGDGFVRVDRHRKGKEVRRKVIPLQADERAPEHRVSLALTVSDVEQSLRGVLPEQSDRIDMILATDGVSKSPRHGLEDRVFEGEGDCRRFLDELAGRAKGDVESDNMSVAFASRETK
jgi:serine/threonine protein phosphatase PrpC